MRLFPTRWLVSFLLALAWVVPIHARAQQPNHGPEKLPQVPDMPRPVVPAGPENGHDDDDVDFALKRQQWFNHLRAYPHEHIPEGARWRALQQHQAMVRAHLKALGQMTGAQAAVADPLSTVKWTPDVPQPVAPWPSI